MNNVAQELTKKQTQKRTDSLVATLQHVLMAYKTEEMPEERLQAIQQVLRDKENQVLQDYAFI